MAEQSEARAQDLEQQLGRLKVDVSEANIKAQTAREAEAAAVEEKAKMERHARVRIPQVFVLNIVPVTGCTSYRRPLLLRDSRGSICDGLFRHTSYYRVADFLHSVDLIPCRRHELQSAIEAPCSTLRAMI